MAKAKSAAKKSAPVAKKATKSAPKTPAKPAAGKPGLLQSAKEAAARLAKAAGIGEKPKGKPAAKAVVAARPAVKAEKPGKAAPAKVAAVTKAVAKPAGKAARAPATPRVERPKPRASKLPPPGEPLTKRELEQILTVGQGRGVGGEGSLKGRLIVKEDFPYLQVIGRDKRELSFLLQGPDQEVFPAYVDHKVSVTGLIRRTNNHGGTVDVRKYSAKKPESETQVAEEPTGPAEEKLRFLSPGEVSMVSSPGMGAGMKGFATFRGNVEMTGEMFVLVVSNGGTRQQVSFTLEGKGTKGLRKLLGQTVQVTGVVDKSSGWGGTFQLENFEPRPAEYRAISRDTLEVVELEGGDADASADVKLNNGLVVRLPEKVGYTWAIEPTTAKRVGLREANFEPSSTGPGSREFFFTPRNPGNFDIEFFLAKAFTPAQVAKTWKLSITVKP